MKRAVLGALAALAAHRLLASPETEGGVPPPHGWIGTTNEWIRGIGIIFALLNLVLLVVIWTQLRRGRVSTVSKALLFGAILVLPVIVVFLATANGMRESMTVEACGACHVMDGHVKDLQNPASDSLAAVHFKNRYIQENHCYTCHSDYGMYGSVSAKLDGLGHVWHNMTGHYPKPIKIAHPYSNLRCLSCHGESQAFLAKHEKEEIPKLIAGTDSCLDCHGPAHKPEEKTAQK